jgi:hypothetical protein
MVLAIAEISLEAALPDDNLFRTYRVSVGRDLFEEWTVSIGYGRIGCTGRERVAHCATLDEAKRVVATMLKRRASAPRRIGCPYRIVHLVDTPEVAMVDALPPALWEALASGPSDLAPSAATSGSTGGEGRAGTKPAPLA